MDMSCSKLLLSFCTIWCTIQIIPLANCLPERSCLEVRQDYCASFFNGRDAEAPYSPSSFWPSTFPNAINFTLPEALIGFSTFKVLLDLDNYCSYLLHSFLCMHFFPPCLPDKRLIVPCRRVCEEAMEECLNYVYEEYLNVSTPWHLECSNFPVEETDWVVIACPSPAIHLDFCLPFDQTNYTVREEDGQVEVCIKLTSIGEYSQFVVPVGVNITLQDHSAVGGEDYIGWCDEMVFEPGSVKGDKSCCNITIIDDLLVEGHETCFVMVEVYPIGDDEFGSAFEDLEMIGTPNKPTPTTPVRRCMMMPTSNIMPSPSSKPTETNNGRPTPPPDSVPESGKPIPDSVENVTNMILTLPPPGITPDSDEPTLILSDTATRYARFGGALSSSTGKIPVHIIDNDECIMPRKHCSNSCNQRDTVNGAVLKNNNYTYVAHIELIGVQTHELCTGIDARILECWEIYRRTCPPPDTVLTIPTCTNCPSFPVNKSEHFLIAGVRQKMKGVKKNILPGAKATGLFAPWTDRYNYDSIADWVQSAIDHRN